MKNKALIKYSEIPLNFKPPLMVAKQAAKGLLLRDQFKRGGTSVGLARARDLKNRRLISAQTIVRMVSYFVRHEIDKKGKIFLIRKSLLTDILLGYSGAERQAKNGLWKLRKS